MGPAIEPHNTRSLTSTFFNAQFPLINVTTRLQVPGWGIQDGLKRQVSSKANKTICTTWGVLIYRKKLDIIWQFPHVNYSHCQTWSKTHYADLYKLRDSMLTNAVPNVFKWKESLGIRFSTSFHSVDQIDKRQSWIPSDFFYMGNIWNCVGKH